MKSAAKFIVIHPPVHKSGGGIAAYHRVVLTVIILFCALAFCLSIYATGNRPASSAVRDESPLPGSVSEALLHYAAENFTSVKNRMSPSEVKYAADVLRRCPPPCNLLVFGLTHEMFLWNSLNLQGRTVFVDESAYLVSRLEERHPSIEAYDVHYLTKVSELQDLIQHYKAEIGGECRSVQNLLFSDCKLAINDLPNYIYDVAWDIILVDGPRGYDEDSPGRMTPLFTAGVLARNKKDGAAVTHVLVHEFNREVERTCSFEFLCKGNLVQINETLAHFIIGDANPAGKLGFC